MKVKTGLIVGKGLGDLVADFTHATRLDKLAELYTRCTGKDCGCGAAGSTRPARAQCRAQQGVTRPGKELTQRHGLAVNGPATQGP